MIRLRCGFDCSQLRDAVLVACAGLVLIGTCTHAGNFAIRRLDSELHTFLTCHWVHLTDRHAISNGVGWLLAVGAYVQRLPSLLWVSGCASVTIASAWPILEPSMGYAGLSGVLHAVLAYRAARLCQEQEWGCISTGIIACLGIYGILLPNTQHSYAFTVATTAHQLGLATGLLCALTAARISESLCLRNGHCDTPAAPVAAG